MRMDIVKEKVEIKEWENLKKKKKRMATLEETFVTEADK